MNMNETATIQLDVTSISNLAECAAAVEGVDAEACARLRQKLAQHAFHLVVAGQFKRGKSMLINALLGERLLPVGVVPLTSVITLLQHGERPSATVVFAGGETREIPIEALGDYVTERGNPKNAKGVRDVVMSCPNRWLEGGIRLVDTPGIGSVHQHNTEVAYQYLPQADAVLFVASVDQPVSRAELDFLADIRRYADKVFLLLNKADYLSQDELDESIAFSAQAVREALGAPVPVFPVSARLALEGKLDGPAELVGRSGLIEFDRALRRFLLEEGGEVWLRSARNNLLRILSQGRLALALEVEALSAPLERLEANLRAFAAKKQETLQAKSDYDALLEADARKLLKKRIEPELERFEDELKQRLRTAVERWSDEFRAKRAKELQAALEQRLVAEIRVAFDDWRAAQDAFVAEAFDRLCGRFWARIQEASDELLRYSAGLFRVPFDSIKAESLWRTQSGFYYKFWDAPTSLSLLAASFALTLPGALGRRLILDRARQRAAELVETQAGRMRHDFEERLKKSEQGFRREMLERIEATIAGIESAINKGMALRRSGEAGTAARLARLQEGQERIAAMEAQAKGSRD